MINQILRDFPIKIPIFVGSDELSTIKHIVDSIDELELAICNSFEEFKNSIGEDGPYIAIADCGDSRCDDKDSLYAILKQFRSPFYLIISPGNNITQSLRYFRLGAGAVLNKGFKAKQMREVLNLALTRSKLWKTTLEEVAANKSIAKELDELFPDIENSSK